MKLYIVHAGYYDDEIGIYELHTNFIVAAHDLNEVKKIMREKEIFIKKNMHIDAVREIEAVDGFKVILEKNDTDTSKFTDFDYKQIKHLA